MFKFMSRRINISAVSYTHLRVAKESIFSGLNNLKINSILDERYSEYFGFTADEVQEMAEYYNASDKYQEKMCIRDRLTH